MHESRTALILSVMAGVAAQLNPLRGTDGSASFATGGISILASVNGPLEVQRRDELPDEAAIEVILRPAAGVGGRSMRTSGNHPADFGRGT